MTNYTEDYLKSLIEKCGLRIPYNLRIFTDTTNIIQIDNNDVLILGDRPYYVGNLQREGRFGIDDQPKHWVRKAVDLETGQNKIIKMVFQEKFQAKIGSIHFDCIRSPKKEARILNLVKGHDNFMQGISVNDSAGNIIRILDFIKGKRFDHHLLDLGETHEDYFKNYFPSILDGFIELVEAILFMHHAGEKHGDIRRDHVLIEYETKKMKWIDFDYNYTYKGRENIFGYDIFGLGNVLTFVTARGDVLVEDLEKNEPDLFNQLEMTDRNIIFRNRVVNLKKIYPYIPDRLNFILLHFAIDANMFYLNTDEFLKHLKEVRSEIC